MPELTIATEVTMKLLALPVPVGTLPTVLTVPPLKEMLGAEVYPEPALVIVMEVTAPLVKFAVAVAPEPPPPLMVTVGATEYRCAFDTMVKLAAVSPMLAVAVAPVPPPPPLMVGVGGVEYL